MDIKRIIFLIGLTFIIGVLFSLLRRIASEPSTKEVQFIVRDTVVITRIETVKVRQDCNCQLRAIGCDSLVVDYSARQRASYFEWFWWSGARDVSLKYTTTYNDMKIGPILGFLKAGQYKPLIGLEINRRGAVLGGFLTMDRKNWGLYIGVRF